MSCLHDHLGFLLWGVLRNFAVVLFWFGTAEIVHHLCRRSSILQTPSIVHSLCEYRSFQAENCCISLTCLLVLRLPRL